MSGILAFILIGILPHGPESVRVDVIEVNHLYDANGKLSFTQVMFRLGHTVRVERYGEVWHHWCHGWQFPKHVKIVRVRGGYLYPSRGKVPWVFAPIFRETWTQHDPELLEREWFPIDKRWKVLQ